MVEDRSNLIAHSMMEIEFSMLFLPGTFLIRLTVYEILRVFWKMAFENTQAPCTMGLLYKYAYLDKQFCDRCVSRGV